MTLICSYDAGNFQHLQCFEMRWHSPIQVAFTLLQQKLILFSTISINFVVVHLIADSGYRNERSTTPCVDQKLEGEV